MCGHSFLTELRATPGAGRLDALWVHWPPQAWRDLASKKKIFFLSVKQKAQKCKASQMLSDTYHSRSLSQPWKCFCSRHPALGYVPTFCFIRTSASQKTYFILQSTSKGQIKHTALWAGVGPHCEETHFPEPRAGVWLPNPSF